MPGISNSGQDPVNRTPEWDPFSFDSQQFANFDFLINPATNRSDPAGQGYAVLPGADSEEGRRQNEAKTKAILKAIVNPVGFVEGKVDEPYLRVYYYRVVS